MCKEIDKNKLYLEKDVVFKSCKSIKEIGEYCRVFLKGFDKEKSKWLICFLNCFNDEDEVLYLIKVNGKTVGCFTLRFKQNFAFLYDFCILKEYRGKGYAMQSLHNIFTLCNLLDIEQLKLYVKETNVAAYKLYVESGFNLSK